MTDLLSVVHDDYLLGQVAAAIPAKQGRLMCVELMPSTPFLCCRDLDHSGSHMALGQDQQPFAVWPIGDFLLTRSEA